MTDINMENLIKQLNYHTDLYNKGTPIISDKEWDSLYFKLLEMEKNTGIVLKDSPTNNIHYTTVNNLRKVRHNHLMLSLAKTKDMNDVQRFSKAKETIAMWKLDGLTCSLLYKEGKLVKAETRGNGIEGEDVTHNAKVISSIPKRIDYKDTLIVDGEIVCKIDTYNNYFSDTYKHIRNFAAGSIRLLDSKECSNRQLTFVAWDAISDIEDCETLSKKLDFLKKLNFTTTQYEILDDNANDVSVSLQKTAKEQNYPIDGIVFKYNSCSYYHSLGNTDHHFRGGLAFKFYDETYPTTLKDIEWSMGRTGILTPIAIFEPIDIDDSMVSRASLHNISILKETLGIPYYGQKLQVFKANMIIPQIYSAEKQNPPIGYDENKLEYYGFIPMPFECPICGGKMIIKKENDSEFLYCDNEYCQGKLVNRLDHFCGKKGLDIKGLSVATLEKLIDWGWIENLIDIFSLKQHRNEWITKTGFGPKSVDNILNAIETGRKCSVEKFIASLGIPLIGTNAARALENNFKTFEAFMTAVDNSFDFTSLTNFGDEMNKAILSFDYTEAKEIVKNYILFSIEKENESNGAALKDLTFVVTGKLNHFKNRDELKEKIIQAGGKVAGSVSKNTNYLINNDTLSSSSKNKTAQELNIPIISEEDFMKTFDIKN